MAKKGKDQQKQAPSKHVTTRRLARWQREKRRQRIIFLSGFAIIVIVIGIIVGGIVSTRSTDWLSKVHTDSGTMTIRKEDYVEALSLFRAGIYNSSTMTNESPLLRVENKFLIEDGAALFGISVSDSEVTDTISASFKAENQSFSEADYEQQYHAYLDRLDISDKEFRDTIKVQMLSQRLLLYYVNQTPTSGEQAAVEQISFYSESQANDVAQKWRNGEEFTTLSTEYGDYNQSGWVVVDALDDPIKNIVSTIEVGNVSDPIAIGNASDATSLNTYYVVLKILERKNDVIPESLRQEWGYKEFSTWYNQAYIDKVERNPELNLAEVFAWAINKLS